MAAVPVKRPVMSEFTTMMAMADTPTPAMEAAPSLPIQIMSMVGPSVLRVLPISIGQLRDIRLPKMLPFVQSRCAPPRPILPALKVVSCSSME